MPSASLTCRKCEGAIAPEDINVAEGAALCRACGMLNRLRDVLDDADLPMVDLARPPIGCDVREDVDGTTVRASTRSISSALKLLGFAVFWNGAVAIFVAQAMAVTYRHVHGHNASWLPVPNWQGYPNGLPPAWFAVCLWLFLTPFMAVGLLMLVGTLLSLLGRVEVRLRGAAGAIFIGAGPLGWKRRFDASAVRSVSLGKTKWWHQDAENGSPAIIMEADHIIRFGSTLSHERRNWMAVVLRQLLVR